jgi:hypothetical protein
MQWVCRKTVQVCDFKADKEVVRTSSMVVLFRIVVYALQLRSLDLSSFKQTNMNHRNI